MNYYDTNNDKKIHDTVDLCNRRVQPIKLF